MKYAGIVLAIRIISSVSTKTVSNIQASRTATGNEKDTIFRFFSACVVIEPSTRRQRH